MSTNRSSVVLGAVIAGIAVSVVGAVTAAASGNEAGNQLAGSWNVVVDRPAPLGDLRSLQTFTGNGSVVEIANGGIPLRTSSHGAWERVEGRLYASTIVFFRFDPQTGAYLGTQKINRTITLSADGNSYTGVGVSTLYDRDGNVQITGLRAPEAGVRIQVEQG